MKKILSFALALVLVCASAFAMADGALKIGVIGPMTGPAADYGLACQRGAIIAAQQLNEEAGATVVELLIEDDEHDAEKSINAYNTVLDQGAQMIAGTTTTTPCIAVGAQAFEDRVFMLTPSASSTSVTEGKDNVYQVCFTDPAQGAASAEYISENKLATKVAVISTMQMHTPPAFIRPSTPWLPIKALKSLQFPPSPMRPPISLSRLPKPRKQALSSSSCRSITPRLP